MLDFADIWLSQKREVLADLISEMRNAVWAQSVIEVVVVSLAAVFLTDDGQSPLVPAVQRTLCYR